MRLLIIILAVVQLSCKDSKISFGEVGPLERPQFVLIESEKPIPLEVFPDDISKYKASFNNSITLIGGIRYTNPKGFQIIAESNILNGKFHFFKSNFEGGNFQEITSNTLLNSVIDIDPNHNFHQFKYTAIFEDSEGNFSDTCKNISNVLLQIRNDTLYWYPSQPISKDDTREFLIQTINPEYNSWTRNAITSDLSYPLEMYSNLPNGDTLSIRILEKVNSNGIFSFSNSNPLYIRNQEKRIKY